MPVIARNTNRARIHSPLVRPFAKSLAVFGASVPLGWSEQYPHTPSASTILISTLPTTGNTTTIYDAGGRNVGRFTTYR
jgi:hypothetical protein